MAIRGQEPPSRRQIFWRRRMVAIVVALALLALLIAAVSSHSSPKRSSGASAAQARARAHRAVSLRPAAAHQAEERAIDHVLSYTPAITAGGSTGKELALTFDDGPGPYTVQLVSELNRLHVHATFFAIGEEEQYFSPGTQLELRSGDVVGDHTETHPMMASLSAHEQYEELFEQIARIELLGGPRPRLFRPPYGSFDATTFKLLHRLHLLMVLWSTDTNDYTLPGVQAIEQSALAGARPGAIILMHDAGGNRSETVAALPAIVAGIRKKGLEPVTIPRLMLDDPPPPGQPIPTSLAGD
ncbi:MAG TPA: polysaccharide deacetylase family protein [Solirubrobacteraceae bacterium]|nr:polysaccharide deacetylase family protein [Solirubrobacteraceae bacterium]